MKLIADSGSTKAVWVILDKTGVKKEFLTQGINPYYQTKEQIFMERVAQRKRKILSRRVWLPFFLLRKPLRCIPTFWHRLVQCVKKQVEWLRYLERVLIRLFTRRVRL